MVVGMEVAITIAVSIFLFILGIGVKMLWNISNTLTKANTKLENISDDITNMSNTLTRTNELLIRQDERMSYNTDRSDGGFNPESSTHPKASELGFDFEPVEFYEVNIDTSDASARGPERSVLNLISHDKRPPYQRDILKGVISGKAREFFDVNDPRLARVSTTNTDDGFYFSITLPTKDKEKIKEFLHVLEEVQLVERIETNSLN